MNTNVKTIGVLTSGGDAPGMNAALRGVVRAAESKGILVKGIEEGFEGLLHGKVRLMDRSSVRDIINHGGTILNSSRSKDFREIAGQETGAKACQIFGLDALVVIGGDGSFAGAYELSKLGVNVICIPATIDLDVVSTEYTIGFDTACNTTIDILSKLRDTTASHQRCSIVEVMGRRAGYIALKTAIACGADYCVIPENGPYNMEKIAKHIHKRRDLGKRHHIIIVAEGALKNTDGTEKTIDEFAKELSEATGIEARGSDTGHILRGGNPSCTACVCASMFGVKAIDIIMQGEKNRVLAYKDNKIVSYPIDKALKMKKTIDKEMWDCFATLAEIDD